MTPEIERERCDELAPKIYSEIVNLLKQLDLQAHISYAITEEVVVHFWRDIERLYATHHEQVHPSKASSYLSFWVRKLKPISDAIPSKIADELTETDDYPHWAEILDVNEQVAIHLALKLSRNCIRDEYMIISKDCSIKETLKIFDRVAREYLTSEFEDGMSMGLRFDSIVYDMRFRTFGPHHLTHVLTHIFREVGKECQKLTMP